LFSFNELPLQVEERSDAFWGRIRILEMKTPLTITQRYYDDLLSDESITAIIPILCKIAKNLTSISRSENSERLAIQLREESDSAKGYFDNELEVTKNVKDFMTKIDLLTDYTAYCMRN